MDLDLAELPNDHILSADRYFHDQHSCTFEACKPLLCDNILGCY